jgi:surfactin synthase thioesterase subunit
VTTLNLLCLPYSGASAMVYSRWRRKLPAWLQVRPVELPGARAWARRCTPTCRPWPGNWPASSAWRPAPLCLLGHSLGALLAFELAHELQALGCPPPLALFACGTRHPTRREDYDGKNWREPKSDAELISELRKLGVRPRKCWPTPS